MYLVYMHVNTQNQKKYIGITKQTLEQRANRGHGYSSQPYFSYAIKKYGWSSFASTVLKDGLTKEEANDLETYYIDLFDTTNPRHGYNQLKGSGELTETTLLNRSISASRTYFQYDQHYNLLNVWDSPRQLKQAGYSMPAIYGCCKGKINSYLNYIWSTTPLEHPDLFANTKLKKIYLHWLATKGIAYPDINCEL